MLVLARLPTEIQPVIQFAAITGWRVTSEVLGLEWRNVDFKAGDVRLDAGTTKNRQGRVFPMTVELRGLLETQDAQHEQLKKAGHIVPWVFLRMVAQDGGLVEPRRIRYFPDVLDQRVSRGRGPGSLVHDAAHRRPQSRARRDPGRRRDEDDGAQEPLGLRALQHRLRY